MSLSIGRGLHTAHISTARLNAIREKSGLDYVRKIFATVSLFDCQPA